MDIFQNPNPVQNHFTQSKNDPKKVGKLYIPYISEFKAKIFQTGISNNYIELDAGLLMKRGLDEPSSFDLR